MKKKKFISYKLPAHWASALINSDETGLTDNEQTELNLVMQSLGAGRRFGNCAGVLEDEPFFCRMHDAPGIPASACYTFLFPKL